MNHRRKALFSLALAIGLAACAQEGEQVEQEAAAADMPAVAAQVYPNIETPVVFWNDAVTAQMLVSEPAVWTGEHAHAGNQVAVVIDAGTLTYREMGEETVVDYEAGQVLWVDAVESHDHANTGESTVRAILITLADAESMGGMAQEYPSAEAEIVFENDRIIAQKVGGGETGVWSGEHAHTGRQLAVILGGGTLSYREAGEETSVTYEPGDAYWVEPTEGHDHALASDTPFEGILITIK